MNNMSLGSRQNRRRDQFVTGYEAMLEAAPDHRNDECLRETEREHCQQVISGMLGRLNDRERQIIISRFGLAGTREKTLNQIGKELGITKERVRQLETRACDKLRNIAEEQKLDLVAF
jgi:RNA polymerase primary sigma factor